MSKRPSSSTFSLRKKQVKQDPNQSHLDAFFRPFVRPEDPEESSRKGKASASSSSTSKAPVRSAILCDGSLADSAAQSHEPGKKTGLLLKSPPESVTAASMVSAHSPVEVIDVDLLDDPEPQLEPSSSREIGASARPYQSVDGSASPASSSRNSSATAPAFLSSIGPLGVATYQSLTVDPPFYDLDSAPWNGGVHAPYSFLTHTLSTLSETRSRIVILNTLTNSLRAISKYHPQSLLPALYLLSNSLSPPYSPLELGLGPSVISKAIQHVSGLTSTALKRLYNRTGDPGTCSLCGYSRHTNISNPQGMSQSRQNLTSEL